jgi:hypothetical protein
MRVESHGGMTLRVETEEIGKILFQFHFVHHKSYMSLRGEKTVTNRLSYNTVMLTLTRYIFILCATSLCVLTFSRYLIKLKMVSA